MREQLELGLARIKPTLNRELHSRTVEVSERKNDIDATVRHLLEAESYSAVADIFSNLRPNATVPVNPPG